MIIGAAFDEKGRLADVVLHDDGLEGGVGHSMTPLWDPAWLLLSHESKLQSSFQEAPLKKFQPRWTL